MKKEEIRKQIADIEQEINATITKAIMLGKEEIAHLNVLYSEMEQLQFKLTEENDGLQ